MPRPHRSLFALVLLSGLVACVSHQRGVGEFGADGFVRAGTSYRIPFADGEGQRLLAGWSVANWHFGRHDRGPDDWQRYEWDFTGDGEVDTAVQLPTNDLVLVHDRTGAILAVRLLPVPPHRTSRVLRVLHEGFLEDVFRMRHRLSARDGRLQVDEQRWRSLVTARNPAQVKGLPASAASFEIFDVDRVRVAPEHREALGRSVFVGTPWQTRVSSRVGVRSVRLALVVTLIAAPIDYAERLGDLETLIERMDFAGRDGETHSVLPPGAA
ncbi:MAG TPA: hypothetical protein RMH80_19275, partial [Polyangiaceae bacterium LLY-WYZ-15_(1-7)]|nr:hypothetical protein [Polyangiaceae bacterium LLY-WYZ-15_(1-7)]